MLIQPPCWILKLHLTTVCGRYSTKILKTVFGFLLSSIYNFYYFFSFIMPLFSIGPNVSHNRILTQDVTVWNDMNSSLWACQGQTLAGLTLLGEDANYVIMIHYVYGYKIIFTYQKKWLVLYCLLFVSFLLTNSFCCNRHGLQKYWQYSSASTTNIPFTVTFVQELNVVGSEIQAIQDWILQFRIFKIFFIYHTFIY